MSETPPKITTFEELKAYAEEHFPETFAKLPPKSYYNVKFARCLGHEEFRLLVGDITFSEDEGLATQWEPVYATVKLQTEEFSLKSASQTLSDMKRIRFREPFRCIYANGDSWDEALKLVNYIRYCLAMYGYFGQLVAVKSSSLIEWFQRACEAVVKEQETKKMLLGIKEPTGVSKGEDDVNTVCLLQETEQQFRAITDETQQFEDRLEQLAAEFKAFKIDKDTEQHILELEYNEQKRENQELQYNYEKLELRLQATDAELDKTKEEIAMWQDKYEKLKRSMLGAVADIE